MDANLKNEDLPIGRPAAAIVAEPCIDSTSTAAPSAAKSPAAAQACRLVYLLSRYPAVSHTFFLNEVQELRKLGIAIDVASINPPDRPRAALPAIEAAEADKTFYVKRTGAAWAAWIALKTLALRPGVFVRGLSAALRLGRWDFNAILFALFYFAEALILGDWMSSRGHRHLHIHFCGPVATVGMLTSIAWGFPYSLTVHGPDEFYDAEKFYLRQKVERAKFILCISDYCRSQLMRVATPQHWDKLHVVRLGVDPNVFLPSREVLDPARVLEILCVGRLVAAKGQLVLLRACRRLISQGYTIRVRLVGTGPDREHLEACAVECGIPAIFEGAKSHSETRQLLCKADIFDLASFAEGVPVALMEAMAMEIPCVSTLVAGIPELIRDGLDGLLVPASSEEDLAAALQRLIDDPLLRNSLGVSGRKRALELYNLPQNVISLARILRDNSPESI